MQVSIILLSMFMMAFYTPTQQELDFGKGKAGDNWYIINDGVMGGLSEGEGVLEANSLRFYGNVSLKNNGGFSSLRAPYQEMDLSGFETVEMRVRGKGQSFGFSMETSKLWFQPNYKVTFRPSPDEWEVMKFSLTDFNMYRIGQQMDQKISQDALASIIRIGFITNDKKEGPFELEIDYIKFE
ncbi:MAG: CIA30 family protein [Bacteroidota bacterium]